MTIRIIKLVKLNLIFKEKITWVEDYQKHNVKMNVESGETSWTQLRNRLIHIIQMMVDKQKVRYMIYINKTVSGTSLQREDNTDIKVVWDRSYEWG